MIEQAVTRAVAALAYPGSVALDTVGFLETLSAADWLRARESPPPAPAYKIEVTAAKPGAVTTMLGIGLVAQRSYDALGDVNLLMIPGGSEEAVAALIADKPVIEWLRTRGGAVERLVAIGTGTFVLAAAGLLAGRRATTHWGSCAALKARHPDVSVDADNIFVQDGNIFTAAGVASAIDLALHFIERDIGRDAAFEVAKAALLSAKRPGGQPQISSHLLAQKASPQLLNGTPEWIIANLHLGFSIEELASRSGMSPRNFMRVFTKEMGLTPGKFIEHARVERARALIQDSNLPMKTIADQAGFGSERNMRRSFVRVLGLNPEKFAVRSPR